MRVSKTILALSVSVLTSLGCSSDDNREENPTEAGSGDVSGSADTTAATDGSGTSSAGDTVTMLLALLDVDFGITGLTPDTELLTEGLLDSLALMEMILALEATFGIRIDDDNLRPDHFASVRTIAQLVDSGAS